MKAIRKTFAGVDLESEEIIDLPDDYDGNPLPYLTEPNQTLVLVEELENLKKVFSDEEISRMHNDFLPTRDQRQTAYRHIMNATRQHIRNRNS